MKAEYDLSKLKSRKNPYASKLKKPVTMRLSAGVMPATVVMTVVALSLNGSALAQRICDPMPIAVVVTFEERAVALDLAQREKLASAWNHASQFPLKYVFLEPKVAESEGSQTERKNLALRRSQYIQAFLVQAGVRAAAIDTSLTYALHHDGPPGHWSNRATQISIFVSHPVDEMRNCLKGE